MIYNIKLKFLFFIFFISFHFVYYVVVIYSYKDSTLDIM